MCTVCVVMLLLSSLCVCVTNNNFTAVRVYIFYVNICICCSYMVGDWVADSQLLESTCIDVADLYAVSCVGVHACVFSHNIGLFWVWRVLVTRCRCFLVLLRLLILIINIFHYLSDYNSHRLLMWNKLSDFTLCSFRGMKDEMFNMSAPLIHFWLLIACCCEDLDLALLEGGGVSSSGQGSGLGRPRVSDEWEVWMDDVGLTMRTVPMTILGLAYTHKKTAPFSRLLL